MFIKNLREQPVNAVVQQSLTAERKAEKKKSDVFARQSRE